MVVRTSSLVYISLFSFALLLSSCQTTQKGWSSFDKKAQRFVQKKHAQSMVVGYLDAGAVSVHSYGVESEQAPFAPDGESIFEIGALTSVFTTTLMVQLSAEGYLDPSDCVNDYLPASLTLPDYHPSRCMNINSKGYQNPSIDNPWVMMLCQPDRSIRKCISLCNLASHTSGIALHNSRKYQWNPHVQWANRTVFQDYDFQEFFTVLQEEEVRTYPGQNYNYSTTGIAILGNSLEVASHTSYQNLVGDKILEPLGMCKSSFKEDWFCERQPIQGHNDKGEAVGTTQFDAYLPAGGLKSTVYDLLLFLEAQIDPNHPLHAVFAQTHEPYIKGYQHLNGAPISMAYGWLISPIARNSTTEVYWINGGTNGFRSFMAFNKENQTAAILLANSAAHNLDDLGFLLMEILNEEEKLAPIVALKK